MPRKCPSCNGTGQWRIGDQSGTCADCLGSGEYTPAPPGPHDVLRELHEWFAHEVEVGDSALQYWVDRIAAVLPREVAVMREP